MYQISKNSNDSFVIVGSYDYRILEKMLNIYWMKILKENVDFFFIQKWNERYVKAS